MVKKHILVTGAAGFIGSFLCEELIKRGHYVVGIDNFFRGKRSNLDHIINEKNFFLEEIDLSDPINVNKINKLVGFHKINAIFHLAAVNGTQYFYDNPLFVLDQNTRITQILLTSLQENRVETIVYTSSSEVYGDPLTIPTNEESPILLKAYADRDSYAASKASGDFYIRLLAEQNKIRALILRVFNMYGERMVGTRYGQVIPEFIERSLSKNEFTIIGDGSNTRSFCYIKDAVWAMAELLEKKVAGIVNVGNDQEISILDLAKKIHQLEGKAFNPHFLPARPYDHKRRRPDITQLKKLLPDLTFTDLETGLKKLIKYYGKK